MNKQNVSSSSVLVTDELVHVFDSVITDEEITFLLNISTDEYSRTDIESISGMPAQEFNVFFDKILSKGLVWKRRRDGNITYSLAPILVGWFEAYLFSGKRTENQVEFSQRLDALFEYWKKYNFSPLRQIRNMLYRFEKPNHRILITPDSLTKTNKGAKGDSSTSKNSSSPDSENLHTVEVNRTVTDSPSRVESSAEVIDLIRTHAENQTIALVHCFCREWHDMVNNPCRFDLPREACIVIGDFAGHVISAGVGRSITAEEAVSVVKESGRKGAVHMVFYEKEDISMPEIGICNCCSDCCGIIGTYNRGITGLHFIATGIAEITNPDNCVACGRCLKFCPVNALSLNDKDISINEKLCIGCGQCSLQCKPGVFSMKKNEREVLLPLLKPSERRFD